MRESRLNGRGELQGGMRDLRMCGHISRVGSCVPGKQGISLLTLAIVALPVCAGPARAGDSTESSGPTFSVIAGATSDYVYRGVSLRDEKPTPLLYVAATYEIGRAHV